jgi:mono/diheme cytochrome c family protein
MHPAALILLLAATSADPAPVDYPTQIKPIFTARCLACHGALKQESGLRLDTGANTRAGGDSGAAVVPGNVADSLLIQRVSATDVSERMPRKASR